MPNKLLQKLKKGQAFFLRQNPDYYFNELRNNAIRGMKRKYDDKRRDEIKFLHQKRRMVNKNLPPKKWQQKEIEFLITEFRNNDYKNLAKKLNRSTGSIEHKIIRLGLQKNNHWKTKN